MILGSREPFITDGIVLAIVSLVPHDFLVPFEFFQPPLSLVQISPPDGLQSSQITLVQFAATEKHKLHCRP